MLAGICRHDKDFHMDDLSFLSLEDMQTKRRTTLTPGKLLALVYTNPKARFQLSYPLYRVSGVGQRRFLIPDIGIRALQGHSRDDVGPEVLTSAHEELFYRTNRLPEYSAHGTSIKAWAELITGTRCLKRGGPKRVRQAAHFAVSLPGNTRRIVSGFRAGSRIYILLDLRAWLRHEGHLTVPPKTPSAFMQTFP